jgi:hypothetical protein
MAMHKEGGGGLLLRLAVCQVGNVVEAGHVRLSEANGRWKLCCCVEVELLSGAMKICDSCGGEVLTECT